MRGFVLTLGFLALITTALGQGSIGGFGGGQGGGGFSGGMGGGGMMDEDGGAPGGRFAPGKRKGDEAQQQSGVFDNLRWNTQTMIATAGIGCDWKFEGKAGEVLIAEAVSDVFDASIKVMDEKGKVLAENDDRAEGNQSPLIIYRFEKDQTIKVNVGSFKNASGGKFEFRNYLFKSFTTKVGTNEIDLIGTETLSREGARSALFHFKAKKNETYVLGTFDLFDKSTRSSKSSLSDNRFFGPSGISRSDFELVENGAPAVKTFKALKDGDFFFEFRIKADLIKARTRLEVVKFESREMVGSTSYTLEPGHQKFINFPVDPNLPLRTEVKSSGETYSHLEGPELPKDSPDRNTGFYGDGSKGTTPTFAWFALEGDPSKAVRTFFSKGQATLILTNSDDKPQTFIVNNDEPLTEFTEGATIQDELAIGHYKLYKYESIKNEMMRLRCEGTSFRLMVEIFDYKGRNLNQLYDVTNNNPGDDLYFPNAQKYLFRISCVGNGGSGTFRLRRDPINAAQLNIGDKKQITLDGKSFGIYEVVLEAGKRYSLTRAFNEGTADFMVMSEDGTVVHPGTYRFDNLRTDVLKIEKTSKYRIWVRGGGNANVTFKIAPYKPPTIDD